MNDSNMDWRDAFEAELNDVVATIGLALAIWNHKGTDPY